MEKWSHPRTERAKSLEIKENMPSPMRVIAERIASGSTRAQRIEQKRSEEAGRKKPKDPYNVALFVEGGGIAAAISAKMLITIMKFDPHLDSIDSLHGHSGGAFNIAYAASDNGDLTEVKKGESIYYENLNDERFYKPSRIINGFLNNGEPSAANMRHLVDHIMRYKKPLNCEAIIGRDLPVIIYETKTDGSVVKTDLTKLTSQDSILKRLRQSSSLPILADWPEDDITDGGIAAGGPPVWEILADREITHAMMLLSRPQDTELPTWSIDKAIAAWRLEEEHPDVAKALRTLDRRYAANMREVMRRSKEGNVRFQTIQVPRTRAEIGVMEMDMKKVAMEAKYGQHAVEAKLVRQLIELGYPVTKEDKRALTY